MASLGKTNLYIFNFRFIALKQLIIKSALFAISILLMVSSVNYFGDAGGIFNEGKIAKIAAYLVEGYNVTNVGNIDERDLQRRIIQLSKITPSTIVLGSSRIMMIKSEYFNTTSFMNHGMSGTSLEDMIAIYQLYKMKGALPQKIVIGIDPWIFNRNNEQTRWKGLAPEYYSFFSSENNGGNTNIFFDKYYQLFSPSYFKSSIRMLLNKKLLKPLPLPTKLKVNDAFTRLSDGSISYDAKCRNVTIQDVDNQARSYIAGAIYSLEKYSTFDKEYIYLFNKFVDEILSNNIQLEFVLMPYHPLVYDFFSSNNKYQIVLEFERYLKNFAMNKKIPLVGSFNPHAFNLNSSHFYDGMHLNERGVEIVLGQPSGTPLRN